MFRSVNTRAILKDMFYVEDKLKKKLTVFTEFICNRSYF